MSTSLRVSDVSKHFGGLPALRGVSLEAPPGRVTALIGPNGAGKSTLANVVSGFEDSDRGRVWLGDRELTGLPAHERAQLGLGRTFQNLEVFEGMSVGDNVVMGAYRRGHSGYVSSMLALPRVSREDGMMQRRARAVLEQLDLTALAGRPVENLAFGQAKLVEIARVLAMGPEVLVMDEPAAGLPPSSGMAVGALIRELADDGLPILLIEHNMRLVMGISDHIVVLDHGEEIARGGPDEIQSNDRVIEAYLGRGAEQ